MSTQPTLQSGLSTDFGTCCLGKKDVFAAYMYVCWSLYTVATGELVTDMHACECDHVQTACCGYKLGWMSVGRLYQGGNQVSVCVYRLWMCGQWSLLNGGGLSLASSQAFR